MSQRLRVDIVRTEAQLQEFIDLPWELHPAHLHMPIMEETIRSWFHGSADHPGRIDLVLVRDQEGAARARSTVHTHDAFEQRLGTPTLFFGATEFADHACLETLTAWAAERGRSIGKQQLLGPVALDGQERCGVITSGFSQPTFMDQPWNPSRVPDSFEALGFERWTEGATWSVDLTRAPLRRPEAAELDARGVEFVQLRRRDMDGILPEIAAAVNEAMGRQHYFTPMDEQQFAASVKDLSIMLDLEIVGLLRDRATGRIASHFICIPNISPAVREARGRMRLWDQAKLLVRNRRYRREALLLVQGTRAEHEGQGLLSMLSQEVMSRLREKGYRRLLVTFIVEENRGSSRQFERVGGAPLHGTTFYRMDLTGTREAPVVS